MRGGSLTRWHRTLPVPLAGFTRSGAVRSSIATTLWIAGAINRRPGRARREFAEGVDRFEAALDALRDGVGSWMPPGR